MSETAAVADGRKTGKAPSMGKFERFLTLWVTLCIIVGIGLGHAMPGLHTAALEMAQRVQARWSLDFKETSRL